VTDVVYVTHEHDPADPHADVDVDIEVALSAFTAAGIDWDVAAWDDRGYDWSGASLVLVRSPWDYVARRREFLSWSRDVSALTRIENPAEVLEANTDKTYLRELEQRGVRTVPTGWVQTIDDVEPVVAQVLGRFGGPLVVKPTVSAGARDTIRTTHATEAVVHAHTLLAGGRGAMVQPYLDSVDGEGEVCVLVVDGAITHAVRKTPALTDGGHGDFSAMAEITPELRATAEHVLAAAGADKLLYARVDLVRDRDGELALLELELTEPALFLPQHPAAATALAAGVASRLR